MRKTATFAIVTLFLINILNFYDRNVAGAVVEPMRKEFHLTDFQIGLLTTAMTVLYAIIGVPLGRVADVWSRKRLLAWGILVWSALTAFTYFAAQLRHGADFETRRGRRRSDLRAHCDQLAGRSGAAARAARACWGCSCWACRSAARSVIFSADPSRMLTDGAWR